jgi:hypothetical protein
MLDFNTNNSQIYLKWVLEVLDAENSAKNAIESY